MKRLLIPSILGYFTVVAAAAFLGSEWRPCAPQRPYHSIFDFYIRFIHEFKCSGLEWLWTLPMIFVLIVFNRSFTLLLRSIRDEGRIFNLRKNNKELTTENNNIFNNLINYNTELLSSIGFISGLMFILHFLFSFPFKQVLFPTILCYLTLPIIIKLISEKILVSNNDTFITSVLAYIPLYISSCYIGFKLDESISNIISHNSTESGLFFNGMRLINEEQPLRLLLAMIFYNIYYLAGFLDLLLNVDTENKRNYLSRLCFPFKVIFLISLNALAFPSNKSLVAYLWAYPYYSGGFTTSIFISGTWVWLEIFRSVGFTLFNTEIPKSLQNHFYQSGIVVYITHAVWLEFLVKYFLLYYIKPGSPFSMYDGKSIHIFNYVFPGFGLLSSWVILVTLSFALSTITYIVAINFKLPSLFFGINTNTTKNRITTNHQILNSK